MNITIRQLQSDDIAAVQDITWQSWMQAYARFIPEPDLQIYFKRHYSAEALVQLFSSPDVHGFAGLAAGRIAGYIKTRFTPNENRFYITSVYVLPEFQGMGVGTALFNRALECAGTYSVEEVWIGVMVENTGALAWYKKLGFQFIREEPFAMGATTVAHLIGRKSLQQT